MRKIELDVVEEERRLFRVSKGQQVETFGEAFRSNYELGRPPRGPEGRVAVIHMALSMFDSADVARQIAERYPKLGNHLATVDLRPGLGLCVAKTGGPSHWSVWGRPDQLAACVADVVSIDALGLS